MTSLRHAAVAVTAAAASGCSLFTTMYSTPGPRPAVHPLPVAGTGLFDWKGVVHCHSHLSHDSEGTIEEISAACRTAQIDFVVMTDHQTDASVRDGARGMIGDTLFVVGAEIRTPQGTVMAFPLTRPLRRWQHAGLLAREAAEQGALALMCHAELWKRWETEGLAGIEIVNLHAGALNRWRIGTLLTALLAPLRVLFERICMRDEQVFVHWDQQLAVRHPFTPVGGNDAHANIHVPLAGTIGTYREVFLTLSTHVLTPQLDEAAIVEGIRLGRTYVAFDVFGEGAGFDFRAIDDNGAHVGGATVPVSPGLQLQVHTPAPGRIELWRDGARLREVEGEELVQTQVEPGIYRVEVRRPGGSPWLFSSTIRVLAAAGSPPPAQKVKA